MEEEDDDDAPPPVFPREPDEADGLVVEVRTVVGFSGLAACSTREDLLGMVRRDLLFWSEADDDDDGPLTSGIDLGFCAVG